MVAVLKMSGCLGYNCLCCCDMCSTDQQRSVIQRKEKHCICRYVHRVGRTGRAGQSGVALSLFTPQDAELQNQLNSSLSESLASCTCEQRSVGRTHTQHVTEAAHVCYLQSASV